MTRIWTWHESEFDRGPGTPIQVRAWLGVVFGLGGAAGLDVEVIASELTLHAIGTEPVSDDDCIVVSADRPPGAIHVEVSFRADDPQADPLTDVVADVLDRRASAWGHFREGNELTSWFEVALPAAGWELGIADDRDVIERMSIDPRAATELSARYEPLIRRLIARYRRTGLEADDLYQVGQEAMLRAAGRFEPSLGSFERFAARTISGTLKKHLRDRGWSVRPPRGLQELVLELRAVEEQLGQQLGRTPTVAEIAEESGREPGEIDRARQAAAVFVGESIDASPDPAGVTTKDRLGENDAAVGRAAGWAVVDTAIGSLDQRQQEIVRLRYFEDLSQRQIAARVGVSQMHVSRLLRASIDAMRESVGVSEPS